VFYKADSAIAIASLQTFPDPETLLGTTRRDFRAFLEGQNYPYLEKADELYRAIHAPALQADPVMAQARKLRLLAWLDQFQAVRRHQTPTNSRSERCCASCLSQSRSGLSLAWENA
jgi:hypothetical protein